MAEFRVVRVAERSPTTCISCGTHEGPFMDLQTTIAQVPTSVGVTDLDIGFYICVGTYERPGCIVQMARMSGLTVDTSVFDGVRLELGKALAENATLKQTLRETLKKKVVSGSDVLEMLGSKVA